MTDEKIFESSAPVHATENLMSFDGCPNRCRDGHYIDPYQHKRVRCEYCLELRKKFVQERIKTDSGTNIAKALRLRESFMGYGNFDIATVFNKSELKKLEDWSVDFVSQVLQHMIERVSLGESVASSIFINLGRRAHSQNFISPFLVRSYISGLTTSPFLRAIDVVNLRALQNGEKQALASNYIGLHYEDVLDTDTCIVYLDAGSGDNELMAVKGLMQLRAWNGKSTVIITDFYSDKMFDLVEELDEMNMVAHNTVAQSADFVNRLIDGSDFVTKDLAVYLAVRYKKGYIAPQQEPSQGMTQTDMKALMSRMSNSGVTN